MVALKGGAAIATMIGDVVDSRGANDRRALHSSLVRALADIGVPSIDTPRLTVGDEFQGTFHTLGNAVDAAFRIRIALLPRFDVRFGLGWGRTESLESDGSIQDGPGWWSAREAIEWVARTQKKSGFRNVRTAVRISDPSSPVIAGGAVNAAVMCRDHLIGSLDDRSIAILRGLMNGTRQKDIATELGVSAPAVSQRIARDGLDVILSASRALHATP